MARMTLLLLAVAVATLTTFRGSPGLTQEQSSPSPQGNVRRGVPDNPMIRKDKITSRLDASKVGQVDREDSQGTSPDVVQGPGLGTTSPASSGSLQQGEKTEEAGSPAQTTAASFQFREDFEMTTSNLADKTETDNTSLHATASDTPLSSSLPSARPLPAATAQEGNVSFQGDGSLGDDFCKSEPNSCVQGFRFCVAEVGYACSCSRNCMVLGNCCQDFRDTCSHLYQEALREMDRFQGVDTVCEPDTSTHFLASCPPRTSPGEKAACLQGSMRNHHDLAPVYDHQTQLSFANRFCALCHGVNATQLRPWNLLLNVGSSKTFSLDSQELAAHLAHALDHPGGVGNKAWLRWVAPERTSDVCFPEAIASCPGKNGSPATPCTGPSSYVTDGSGNIYINKDCLVCNGKEVCSPTRVEDITRPRTASQVVKLRWKSAETIEVEGIIQVWNTSVCTKQNSWICSISSCQEGYEVIDGFCTPTNKTIHWEFNVAIQDMQSKAFKQCRNSNNASSINSGSSSNSQGPENDKGVHVKMPSRVPSENKWTESDNTLSFKSPRMQRNKRGAEEVSSINLKGAKSTSETYKKLEPKEFTRFNLKTPVMLNKRRDSGDLQLMNSKIALTKMHEKRENEDVIPFNVNKSTAKMGARKPQTFHSLGLTATMVDTSVERRHVAVSAGDVEVPPRNSSETTGPPATNVLKVRTPPESTAERRHDETVHNARVKTVQQVGGNTRRGGGGTSVDSGTWDVPGDGRNVAGEHQDDQCSEGGGRCTQDRQAEHLDCADLASRMMQALTSSLRDAACNTTLMTSSQSTDFASFRGDAFRLVVMTTGRIDREKGMCLIKQMEITIQDTAFIVKKPYEIYISVVANEKQRDRETPFLRRNFGHVLFRKARRFDGKEQSGRINQRGGQGNVGPERVLIWGLVLLAAAQQAL